MFQLFKKTTDISTTRSVKVRGYEIRRAPVGKFIHAVRLLETVPMDMLQSLFGTMDISKVLAGLSHITQDDLMTLIVRAVGVLPEKLVEIFAELAELDKDKLLRDSSLGLDGMVELMNAWVELNGIVNFTQGVAALLDAAKAAKSSRIPNTGSSV